MASIGDQQFIGAYLADLKRLGIPTNVAEYRKVLFELLEHRKNREPLPAVGAYHESVPINSTLTADIAVPSGPGAQFPAVLLCHGNGGIAGSAHSYRRLTRDFAAAGYVCVTPDFRLGPEHKYPAGLDDLVETGKWVQSYAASYAGDGGKIIVCGDSIGATMGLAAVLRLLEDPSAPRIRAFVGLEGHYDLSEDESFIIKALLPEGLSKEDRKQPWISPPYGIQAGQAMPPILLITASADFAAPSTLQFAINLFQKGIPFELHVIEGMIHDFMKFPGLDGYRQGHKLMFDFLERLP